MQSIDLTEQHNTEQQISAVSDEQQNRRFFKLQVKFLVVATSVCLGYYMYIPGPTLIDLGAQVDEKILNMPLIYTSRAVGYITGCVIGACMYQICLATQKLVVLFFMMLFLSVSSFCIAACRNFTALMISFCASGVCTGALVTGINNICLTFFKGFGYPIFRTLSVFYALGSLLAPLIARGYVNKDRNTTMGEIFFEDWIDISVSAVSFVYVIFSVAALIVSLLWLAIYCYTISSNPYISGPKSSEDDLRPLFKYFTIINTSVMSFLAVTIGFCYIQLLPTYGVLVFEMTQVDTCDLLILFQGCFALGRLLAFFLPKSIMPHNLQTVGIILVCIGAFVMFLYMEINSVYFWVANAIIGFGASPLIPSLLACLSFKMDITDSSILLLNLTGALAELVVPFFLSQFIWLNYTRLKCFMITISTVYLIFLLFQYFLLYILYDRHNPQKNPMRTELPNYLIRHHLATNLTEESPSEQSLDGERKSLVESERLASTDVQPGKIFDHLSETLQRVRTQNQSTLVTVRNLQISARTSRPETSTSKKDREA